MEKFKITSHAEAETQAIAKRLAAFLKPGAVLTLSGDLGVGKTAFTKGLAIGLGVTDRITSPTFTILKEYDGELPLYHMDVYRLEHSEEDIGFDEYFYGDGVTVIEWAQFIEEYLPETYLSIRISRTGDQSRDITIEAKGAVYQTVLDSFVKSLRSHEK